MQFKYVKDKEKISNKMYLYKGGSGYEQSD